MMHLRLTLCYDIKGHKHNRGFLMRISLTVSLRSQAVLIPKGLLGVEGEVSVSGSGGVKNRKVSL